MVRKHYPRELGDGRISARSEADTYHDYGFTGERPNAARHSYGDITIAVIESGVPEDEACMFYDWGCSGASRIRARYVCDGTAPNECASVSNFASADEVDHTTLVASVIVGDYMDGQGDGHALGDPAWTSGAHSDEWERLATGIAPESSIVFFGKRGTNSSNDAFADAISKSYSELSVDIINGSWVLTGTSACDVLASEVCEEEVENAFDDGVFVAQAVGNVGIAGACNVQAPADIPKAFAVGSLDSERAACEANYTPDCTIKGSSSAKGGGSVTEDGTTYANVESMVDLVAPGNVTYMTEDGSTDGADRGLVTIGAVSGSSIATPHVAGAAALVKDYFLNDGLSWINNPGRLHAVMLAMADRHWSSNPTSATQATTQATSGADPYFGMGRLNLRLFESGTGNTPYGLYMSTVSFTNSSSGSDSFPFGVLPSGVGLFKCVANQAEDMSDKTDVSKVDLSITVRHPVSTGCSYAGAVYIQPVVDQSRDTKAMVAVDTSLLAGKCVEVSLTPRHVTQVGITVNTYC